MITIDLIRKRSEHNDGEIHSLEELTLHQESIERIELLDTQCKNLKILYLQNNLISKIENLSRLKKLQYLNLAINNIEVVENLESCESLQKLDLTLNFIGRISSFKILKGNKFLEELHVSGNPCSNFQGCREYIITSLEQIKNLDGLEISPSERIKAKHFFCDDFGIIDLQEKEFLENRALEIIKNENYLNSLRQRIKNNPENLNSIRDEFMKKSTSYSPEIKVFSNYLEKLTGQKSSEKIDKCSEKKSRCLFKSNGRPYNINELKLKFSLDNHYSDPIDSICYMLKVPIYRHLDTSKIDCDIHPNYVRITIKDRILQIHLEDEVIVDKSSVVRSQTTGELVVKMPKLDQTKTILHRSDLIPKSVEKNISLKKMEYLELSEPLTFKEKLLLKNNNFCHEEIPELI